MFQSPIRDALCQRRPLPELRGATMKDRLALRGVRIPAASWYHFDHRFHLAAILSWLMHAAMLGNPWPEQDCELSETFITEQLPLIRCAATTPFALIVQGRPRPSWDAIPPLLHCVTGM